MLVGRHNVRNTDDVWVLCIAIDSKAMTHFVEAHMPWDASKTENGETSVVVVRFNNLPNVPQGLLVLISVSFSIKMERAHLTGVTIARGIINRCNE